MITVCKDCADRYIGCHSECERYRHQKDEAAGVSEKRRAEMLKKDYFYSNERSHRLKRGRRK